MAVGLGTPCSAVSFQIFLLSHLLPLPPPPRYVFTWNILECPSHPHSSPRIHFSHKTTTGSSPFGERGAVRSAQFCVVGKKRCAFLTQGQ